jgi:hypothetical protein
MLIVSLDDHLSPLKDQVQVNSGKNKEMFRIEIMFCIQWIIKKVQISFEIKEIEVEALIIEEMQIKEDDGVEEVMKEKVLTFLKLIYFLIRKYNLLFHLYMYMYMV